MSDENTNVQPAANTEPAPATGPTVEEQLAQMKAEFERTREGLVRDLQQERAKRHELEQKVYSQPAPSAVKPDVTEDELGKVLAPYMAPVKQELAQTRAQLAAYEEDKALNFLAEKTGKSKEQILKDADFQNRLVSIQNRFGFSGSTVEVTKKVMEIYEMEDIKAKEAERARTAAASKVASIPSGSAPAPVASGKEYSAEDFSNLSPKEFHVMSQSGSFHKVGDKFVYKSKK
jgi:hypothetical protein